MMNNYDCNSNGLSVEVSVWYDSLQSQDMFDMSFIRLLDSTYQFHPEWCDDNGQGRFTDFARISGSGGMYEIAKTPRNKRGMMKYLIDCRYPDFRGWDFEDTLQSFLNEFRFPRDLKDFVETLEQYDIEHTLKFERYVSRGYSQGDAIEVFINKINIYDGMKKDIDHMLWDAPIVASAVINGEDYYCEFKDGEYAWDRDEFIQNITEQCGIPEVKQILEDLTPEYPEY